MECIKGTLSSIFPVTSQESQKSTHILNSEAQQNHLLAPGPDTGVLIKKYIYIFVWLRWVFVLAQEISVARGLPSYGAQARSWVQA